MYEEKMDISLRRVKEALFRFKKTGIFVGLVVATAIILGNTILFPDKYETSALVQVQNVTVDSTEDPRTARVRIVQEDILSHRVLQKVVEELELNKAVQEDSFLQGLAEAVTGKVHRRRDAHVDAVVRDLRGELVVMEADNTGGSTRLFTVSMKGKYPETIAKIVNRVVNEYIAQKTAIKSLNTQDDIEFIKQQVNALRQALRVAAQKLNLYKAANAEYTVNENTMTQALYTAKMRLVTAEGELTQAKTLESSIRQALRSEPQTLVASAGPAQAADIATMNPHERADYLESHIQALRTRYTERHPEVENSRRELAALRSGLTGVRRPPATTSRNANPEYLRLRSELATAVSTRRSAEATISLIKQEIESLTAKLKKAPQIHEVLNALQAVKDAAEAKYNGMTAKLATLSVTLNAATTDAGSNFRVVDPALTPTSSLIRSRFIFHMLGIIAGLFLGVVAAVALGFSFDEPVTQHILTKQRSLGSRIWSVAFYWLAAITVIYLTWYIIVQHINQSLVVV